MPQSDTVNRRVVLAARPRGLPTPQDFRLDETAVPTPNEGQVLLRTLYLSLDPYMRQLMNEIGPTYAPSVRLGESMAGGTVNRIVASKHPQFRTGDLVLDGTAAASPLCLDFRFRKQRLDASTRAPCAGSGGLRLKSRALRRNL